MRAAGRWGVVVVMVGGGIQGDRVDGCPPFVLQIRGKSAGHCGSLLVGRPES